MILSHKRLTSLSPPLRHRVCSPPTRTCHHRTARTAPAPRRRVHPAPTLDRARTRSRNTSGPTGSSGFCHCESPHRRRRRRHRQRPAHPGNPIRKPARHRELTSVATQHQRLPRRNGQALPDVLPRSVRWTDYLDTHGRSDRLPPPARRLHDIDLPHADWHDLCYQAETDPGQRIQTGCTPGAICSGSSPAPTSPTAATVWPTPAAPIGAPSSRCSTARSTHPLRDLPAPHAFQPAADRRPSTSQSAGARRQPRCRHAPAGRRDPDDHRPREQQTLRRSIGSKRSTAGRCMPATEAAGGSS